MVRQYTRSFVASALGLAVVSDDPISEVVQFLKLRRVMFILDSCEHILDAASILAESILRGTSEVRMLATSREPLRAEGESIYHLAPLETPPESTPLTARQALTFSNAPAGLATAPHQWCSSPLRWH